MSMEDSTVDASVVVVLVEPVEESPMPALAKKDRSRLLRHVNDVRADELAEGEAETEPPVNDKRCETGEAVPELLALLDRALSVLETASSDVGLDEK